MTRPSFVRRAAAAAVLPLALTSLGACGGSDSGSKAQDASSSSSSSPTASSSAGTPSAGETVDPADFVARFQDGFDNTDTAHETMKMSMGSNGSLTGEGDVDYTGDSPALVMTLQSPMAGGEIEMRLVDEVMYMSMPGMADGKYVKLDLNDPNSPFGTLGSQLDPQEAMKSFGAGIEKVTYVGADGGLDEYLVTVDTKKMLEKLGQSGSGAALGAMPDQVRYNVWLDDQDRINKLTIDLGHVGTMEMSLSDFGKDVSVEAPPSDDVTEFPGMTAQG